MTKRFLRIMRSSRRRFVRTMPSSQRWRGIFMILLRVPISHSSIRRRNFSRPKSTSVSVQNNLRRVEKSFCRMGGRCSIKESGRRAQRQMPMKRRIFRQSMRVIPYISPMGMCRRTSRNHRPGSRRRHFSKQ